MTARKTRSVVQILIGLLAIPSLCFGEDPFQAPTTFKDLYRAGTQWGDSYQEILSSENCGSCHGSRDESIPIMKQWQGGMHAQTARDPIFLACLAIAEQDAAGVGDFCMRCHIPRAWLAGRSRVTDGSAVTRSDRDSINCHFCHLLVDPDYKPGISPLEDEHVLGRLADVPRDIDSANYVVDPFDRRRGKRGLTDPQPHSQVKSAFFDDSRICEICHDAGNPVFTRQPDDTYVLNAFDEPHPTGNKYDMFPLERTSSEWKESTYAKGGVDAGGRFGGTKRIVSTCQDCHMPDTVARNADFPPSPIRTDTATHGVVGGNTYTQKMIANLYPDEVDVEAFELAMGRARDLLQAAATLELSQIGDDINVRIINEGGHKLPTGQASGRRMWINVQFHDPTGALIAERGAYDSETAVLTQEDTVVYSIALGVDDALSEATGVPVGPTHHGAFCNVIYKDNRIPARGFTNEGYRRVQSPVVGAGYSDGQYWDDSAFLIPDAATSVTVKILYQTLSKDFVDFLRDENYTNNAGEILYEQWVLTGKCPPVEMNVGTLSLVPFGTGDYNGVEGPDRADYSTLAACLAGPNAGPLDPACQLGDMDGDGDIDLTDAGRFMRRFGRTD